MAVPSLLIYVEGSNLLAYDTYANWGLIPTGRLTINPADFREKYLEIPGREGELDITDILTGEPVLKNRTGSWDFYVVPYGYAFVSDENPSTAMRNKTPEQMCRTVYNAIHGKKVQVYFPDDLNHYYSGRVKVKSWSPGKTWTRLTIDYNLEPTRKARASG